MSSLPPPLLLPPATKVDAGKTKSKAPASSGATNLNLGPAYDPFATADPFEEASPAATITKSVGKADKIHVREYTCRFGGTFSKWRRRCVLE